MRVFVTGATGFVGTVVTRELIGAGHQVLGLARSDQGAAAVKAAGAEVHRGTLDEPESLQRGAAAADGVIHTAFNHDFSNHAAAIETDRCAIAAMLETLKGSAKPFVSTSGTALVNTGRVATEADAFSPDSAAAGRGEAERMVLTAAETGVRTSIMRLPPSVHGAGDHGFVPMLVDMARRTGVSAYVGDGANRWPAVHRLDAARLYRLALEKAKPGTRLHANAEDGIPFREIATAIGQGLGLPVKSLNAEEAQAHFTWFFRFVTIDNPTSNAATRETFGWRPEQPGLLADMKNAGYFDKK